MLIVDKEDMSRADSFTIKKIGLSGENLMENAAQAISEKIQDVINQDQMIVVLSGIGNNGGDGIAIARRLLNAGFNAELWLIPPEEQVRNEALTHMGIYKRHGYEFYGFSEEIYSAISEADVIIDALLGNGVSGEPRSPYKDIIEAVNESQTKVLSIDLPSGINANLAQVSTAIKADITYLIGFLKKSCFLYPAAKYYGSRQVVDIGIPELAVNGTLKQLWDEDEYLATLVQRSEDSHKGTNGKALIIGGSKNMLGAPILSAGACLKGGIGLLCSAVPSHVVPVMASTHPESTFVSCEEADGCLNSVSFPEKIDVVAIGMGMGRSDQTADILKSALGWNLPMVIDADALYFLNSMWEVIDSRKAVTIITPHMGEMARICGLTTEQVQNSRFEVARETAVKHNIYVVLKGPFTIVTTPEGDQYVNNSGNAGLAKGGSGDVLTGLITGMLPRYNNPQHAISNAVYLHGKAADKLLENGYNIDAITPSALLEQFSKI